MIANQLKTDRFVLGVEELGLVMGMLDRPVWVWDNLQQIYPNITERQMKSRLASAINSLLARDLCTLTEKMIPQLAQDFHKALLPLATYDQIIQLRIVMSSEMKKIKFYIQNRQCYCSHSSEKGVIHTLEHGQIDTIIDNFMLYFPKTGQGRDEQESLVLPLTQFKQTGNNLEMGSLQEVLIENGWDKKNAKEFSLDFTHPVMLADITKLEVNNKMSSGEITTARTKTLTYLTGRKHNWLLDSSINDVLSVNVYQTSFEFLRNTLSVFLEG